MAQDPAFPASSPRKAFEAYQRSRIDRWDQVALQMDRWTGWGGHYRKRVERIYQSLIPPGKRVLEIGCAQGHLLAACKPSFGAGIDFSAEMLRRARVFHPELHLIQGDAHDVELEQRFDFIILSDVVNDLWDVQTVLEQLSRACTPGTRLIFNFYSRLWEQPLALAEALGLAKPTLHQNWVTIEDIRGLLNLAGFEEIRHWHEVMWPLPTPLLADFCNRCLVKVWPFGSLGMTNFLIARPIPCAPETRATPRVSVVVPVRNEAGNIGPLLERTPRMGAGTEIVFVEGHSTDDSYAEIERQIARRPRDSIRLLRQTGTGKGDAVRLGFSQAEGDALIILDADLTVPPEDLPRFYEALVSGKGDFINGVRLVYPIEGEAMRFFNLIANKVFSLIFTWILGQPVKDTLCGTKALWRRDYEAIAENRASLGDFDPFGDFDLLFGAARLNLKIVDVPVRYRRRTYGTTNIQRWTHGWLLLKMAAFATLKLKFA